MTAQLPSERNWRSPKYVPRMVYVAVHWSVRPKEEDRKLISVLRHSGINKRVKKELKNNFFMALAAQSRAMASSFLMFFEITHNDTPQSVGLLWTSDQPVAETSTWQHTTQQTSMPPAGFESTMSAGERPQTYALDRAATGTGTTE